MTPRQLAFATGLLVLSACNENPVSQDPKATPQMRLRVGEAEYASFGPALVSAKFPAQGPAEAEVSFEEEGKLSVVVQTPIGNVEKVTAEVIARPLVRGQSSANVVIGTEPADSGTIEFGIKAGRISGEIRGLDVQFDGNVVLTCLVPPTSLEQGPAPGDETGVATPEGESPRVPMLVVDSARTSPECKSLSEKLL